ncbi:purine-cytosine permease family protein [Catenovulum sp. SX2]|uniref:purine-cytosine permease family protein n=1 Tax=Catenovulum sp. SX2 TaxID=3398614 RepID=UPI003F876262
MQSIKSYPAIPAKQLKPASYFAGSYAGEHVAGTEFVIGALFVSWGVGTIDLLLGLIIGNLLAVLTWALVCAPIATDSRLTLYAYLEKIAGKGMIKLYSILNGMLFCILAGAMITVSASAIRILLGIPPQVDWLPTSMAFVAVALAVGAVVVFIAVKGFSQLAKFAQVCAPWMILMFICGALVLIPDLIAATPEINQIQSFNDFLTITDMHIWQATDHGLNMWHVAMFAWICNLAMHGGMSDMTILRFARSKNYGYFAALGMFIGHFLAWICAGMMGAGAGLLLNMPVNQLDAGEVAYQALGAAGILAVVIAGWTTSNPTIYRAGLAFQSVFSRWSRVQVTTAVGVITTIIACFPFVFSQLMGFLSVMALVLAPIGGIIFAEHWLLTKLKLTRFWFFYQQQQQNKQLNLAALLTWLIALLVSFVAFQLSVHEFVLPILAWFIGVVIYPCIAGLTGAKQQYAELQQQHEQAELTRKQQELDYLNNLHTNNQQPTQNLPTGRSQEFGFIQHSSLWLALISLVGCLLLACMVVQQSLTLNEFQQLIIWPTLIYFISASYWSLAKPNTH